MQVRLNKSTNIRAVSLPSGYTGTAGLSGQKRYIADVGTVLYNNSFLNLGSLAIPFETETFFVLPQDKDKYAVVNVYYDAEHGKFVFDKIGIFDRYVDKVTHDSIINVLPIGQFTLKQSGSSFEVVGISEYTQMSTFTVTDNFIRGDTGLKADNGVTGLVGLTGVAGLQGITGSVGATGSKGITGISSNGLTGAFGDTGYYSDLELSLHLRFKTADRTVVDYSSYERDFYYSATGVYDSNNELRNYYTVEEGPSDNCHAVTYAGGLSSYRRNEYLAFGGVTGTFSAWVKLSTKPVPDFSYEVNPSDSLVYQFRDTSLKDPIAWQWWFGYDAGLTTQPVEKTATVKNPVFRFSAHGDYVVKLRVTNRNGYSEHCKILTV